MCTCIYILHRFVCEVACNQKKKKATVKVSEDILLSLGIWLFTLINYFELGVEFPLLYYLFLAFPILVLQLILHILSFPLFTWDTNQAYHESKKLDVKSAFGRDLTILIFNNQRWA